MSSIVKSQWPKLIFYCNNEAYSTYYKEYKEYFDWIKNRNKERFDNNIIKGNGYDTKNMMHCHRLLDMCIDVFSNRELELERHNNEELMAIRLDKMKYEDVLKSANDKIKILDKLYNTSTLPDKISSLFCKNLLLNFRKEFYNF